MGHEKLKLTTVPPSISLPSITAKTKYFNPPPFGNTSQLYPVHHDASLQLDGPINANKESAYYAI